MKFTVKGLTQSIIDKKDDYKEKITITTLPAFEPHPPPPTQSDYTYSIDDPDYDMSYYAYDEGSFTKNNPFSYTGGSDDDDFTPAAHRMPSTRTHTRNVRSKSATRKQSKEKSLHSRSRTDYDYEDDNLSKISAEITSSYSRPRTAYGLSDDAKKISADVNSSYSRPRTAYDFYDEMQKKSANVDSSHPYSRTSYDFNDESKKISADVDSSHSYSGAGYGINDESKKISADVDSSHSHSGTGYYFNDDVSVDVDDSLFNSRKTGMVITEPYVAPEKPSIRPSYDDDRDNDDKELKPAEDSYETNNTSYESESTYSSTKTSKSYGPYPSLERSDFSYSPIPQTSYHNRPNGSMPMPMPTPYPDPFMDDSYNDEPPPPYTPSQTEVPFSYSGGDDIKKERIGGDVKGGHHRRRQQRSTAELRECAICCSEKELTEFKPITENCAHMAIVCLLCIELHIRHEVYDKGKTEIKCPGLDGTKTCQETLTVDHIKEFATNDVYKRFDQLTCTYALAAIPDFYWCKNPGCKSGQIHSDGEIAPIMTCQACGAKSCVTHDMPIPANSTRCLQCDPIPPEVIETPAQPTLSRKEMAKLKKQEEERVRKLAKAERATKTFLSNKTKSCPKCGTRIQKNGGCDHMTCTVPSCKHEFCWRCFADYKTILEGGNEFHATSCKYYAPPPPS